MGDSVRETCNQGPAPQTLRPGVAETQDRSKVALRTCARRVSDAGNAPRSRAPARCRLTSTLRLSRFTSSHALSAFSRVPRRLEAGKRNAGCGGSMACTLRPACNRIVKTLGRSEYSDRGGVAQ